VASDAWTGLVPDRMLPWKARPGIREGPGLGVAPLGGLDFTAIGTAVRAPGAARGQQAPFTCDVSGQDFAKLITAGWVPAGLAARYLDRVAARRPETARQARRGSGNVEVAGWTELVNQSRHDARRQLEQDVRRIGAEGVVITGMQMRVRERDCPVDRPEFLGGCDLWESWDSWHHGSSTPLSCGNVRWRWSSSCVPRRAVRVAPWQASARSRGDPQFRNQPTRGEVKQLPLPGSSVVCRITMPNWRAASLRRAIVASAADGAAMVIGYLPAGLEPEAGPVPAPAAQRKPAVNRLPGHATPALSLDPPTPFRVYRCLSRSAP